MMSEVEADAVRDAVIDHLSHQRLEEGERLLEDHSDGLPEAIRFECLGTAAFYRRDLQEAVRCFEAAIALAPDRVIARYQYLVGTQVERQGNFVDAFKRYQAAIDAEPAFVDAYVELGGLLTKVEDWEGALRCYQDAVRLDPSDIGNHHNLVVVLERLVALNPPQYKAELETARLAYEQATRSEGSKDRPTDHQW